MMVFLATPRRPEALAAASFLGSFARLAALCARPGAAAEGFPQAGLIQALPAESGYSE